jgi:hypothetical protein
MTAEKRGLTEWPVWVLSYILAHLIVFGGTALTLYLWAAPPDDWGATLGRLFWRSFAHAMPLGMILGTVWRNRGNGSWK